MSLYAAVVFVHAATILLFFIAHAASVAVASPSSRGCWMRGIRSRPQRWA